MRGGRIHSRTRVVSCLLAGLMVLGFPGPGLVLGAPAPPSPSGNLSVDSDPAGAAVLVDGQAQGTTPVALQALPAGDHRVRVVKDGYLDNSRVVKVAAGQTERLQVRLTHSAMTTVTTQVEGRPSSEKKGGSGKKWALIGLAAAGVGAAAFVVLTKNDPPIPGTIGVSPTGTGMAGFTPYTFSSVGSSDPDNDPLTYEWNFGDGASGSGQSATHTYANPGSFSVTLTVKDEKHSVAAPGASVTVARSVAGVWTGGVNQALFGANMSVNLTQSGSSIGGTLTFSGGLAGTVPLASSGTVSALTYPCTVTFVTAPFRIGGFAGTFTVRFSGPTDAGGTSMTGTVTSTQTAGGVISFSGTTTFRR